MTRKDTQALIVEHDEILAIHTQNHLKEIGIAITGVADTAIKAFQLIERQVPDIVLMNIGVPGELDSIEAAGIIRKRYLLPVIFLIDEHDQAHLERAEAEAFGYIIKPLEPPKTRAAISMTLRRHRSELEAERSRALLAHSEQQLETANRAKGEFLARMGHEIRTPMNLIMGTNALLLESSLSEKQKQCVDISYRNVRRLLRLMNGILDLNRAEADDLVFQSAPFDLDELLKECAATISAAVERKGLKLEISLAEETPRYWLGDPERLQQVLLNLIGNSIKFTERGKIEVRVTAESGTAGEIGLRFEVTDSGVGIPRDKASLIFEAFQQADGSMNRRAEGPGLGLTLAKILVERMAGRIWLQPDYEHGAKFLFTVFLPPSVPSALQANRAKENSIHQDRGVELTTRILLVEDNPDNVILVQEYLRHLPISIDIAVNGLDGLAKRRQHDYDLILMDIQMPIMDGYTATREIRMWERATGAKRVPIVAATAHALNGDACASIQAGCDAHLTKPVSRAILIDAISQYAVRADRRAEKISGAIQVRRPVFLANRWLDLEKMRAAAQNKDFALIERIGHNCKGVSGAFGFPQISEVGAKLEAVSQAEDTDKVLHTIADFERCLLLVSSEIA